MPGQQMLMVRSDTELQSGGTPGSTPGGLCIREDTQFVSVSALGEPHQHQHQLQLQQRSGGRTPRAPPPSPRGLGIREDTQFGGFGCAPGALGGGRPTPPSTGPGGLCIREDTQFVSMAAVAGAGSGAGAQVATYPWTGGPSCPGSAAGAQVGKWGFAPGADDTLALLSGGALGGYLSRELHGRRLSGEEQEEDINSEVHPGDAVPSCAWPLVAPAGRVTEPDGLCGCSLTALRRPGLSCSAAGRGGGPQ
jgi:hypothetical protein